jgi:hypothetical protein
VGTVATCHQVRLSQLMRWNMLPVGHLASLVAGKEKIVLIVGLSGVSFALAYYAGSREHRIYKARKHALEILQKKVRNEKLMVPGDTSLTAGLTLSSKNNKSFLRARVPS